jgi:hypothetical protein
MGALVDRRIITVVPGSLLVRADSANLADVAANKPSSNLRSPHQRLRRPTFAATGLPQAASELPLS